MKSQGFSQTPQDIIEEYNGCSVPQYTAYPSYTRRYEGDIEGYANMKSNYRISNFMNEIKMNIFFGKFYFVKTIGG